MKICTKDIFNRFGEIDHRIRIHFPKHVLSKKKLEWNIVKFREILFQYSFNILSLSLFINRRHFIRMPRRYYFYHFFIMLRQ